jgi:putative flippase GtrA
LSRKTASLSGAIAQRILALADAMVAALSRYGLSEDFIRFACVGTIGLCWDTATVYALRGLTGLYIAGAISYGVVSTANWGLNRLWTFRARTHAAAHVQWMKFILANLVGFAVNRGTYFTLISIFILCHRQPVIAIIAGSVTGLCFNYFLSKRFVFG